MRQSRSESVTPRWENIGRVRTFEGTWLSDDPLADLDDPSLFGRAILVQRILEVLQRIRQESPSATIGLIGAWGSGKTTVLQSLVKRVGEPSQESEAILDDQWSVAQFNPWLYSDAAALHAGFFAELRSSLPKERRWNETRSKIAALGKRLAPLSALTGLVGVNSEHAIESLLKQITDSAAEQQERVAKVLRPLNDPSLAKVEGTFDREPELVIRKIWSRIDDDNLDRSALVRWLTQRHAQSPEQGSVRHRIEGLVANIVGEMTVEKATPLMREVATTVPGSHLWGMVRHLLAADAVGDQRVIERHNQLATAMTEPLVEHYRDHFDHRMRSTASPFDIPTEEAALAWLWREIDPAGLRELLRTAVAEDRWTLLDELAWLVPVVISAKQGRYISRYNDLDHFAELFDLDAAAEALHAGVETAGTLEQYRDTEATPEHRRGFALALLKYHRDGKLAGPESS